MTRFMMTLQDAVTLVIYAFEHGVNGDIFVQKAPAATIEVLAKALVELYSSKSKIKVIGTRHGEKLYESLISREEMAHAINLGEYYRIPADTYETLENCPNYWAESVAPLSISDSPGSSSQRCSR